mgnify:FL=1
MEPTYVIAIEIGSSKIRAALGTIDATNTLSIKAIEEEILSESVRYGQVRNVMQVSETIRRITTRLQSRESSHTIAGVYLAFGGLTMRSERRTQQRMFPNEQQIVQTHISDLTKDVAATQIPNRDIVEVQPCEFYVDRRKTTNPVGNYGRSIDGVFTLISASSSLKKNLERVFENLSLKVLGYVVRPIAEANLVLTSDEKRAGCMLVDFGAETTTVVIYKDGNLVYLNTIPLGSRHITLDIMHVCHIEEQAEQRKRSLSQLSGNANAQSIHFDAMAEKDLTEIKNLVNARTGEIIANILEQIRFAELKNDDLPAGIIVVGSGARLHGFNDRLATVSRLPVRTGLMNNKMVRITDSRIDTTNAIDVISILADIKEDPIPCMVPVMQTEIPFNETQPAQNIPTMGGGKKQPAPAKKAPVYEEPEDEDPEEEEIKPVKTGFFPRFVEKLKRNLTNYVSEDEDNINE